MISNRSFKLTKFVFGQSDGDRVFTVANELGRLVVVVAEDLMSERFTRTLHRDGVAVSTPADIDLVRRLAIEGCEGTLDSSSVEVGRVHFFVPFAGPNVGLSLADSRRAEMPFFIEARRNWLTSGELIA
jgi:hypothetical protein